MSAATAATAGVSSRKHDGTICDAKPNGPAVHGATDDDARAGIDTNDVAGADDGAATGDDGANGAIISHGPAPTLWLTANKTGAMKRNLVPAAKFENLKWEWFSVK